MPKILVLTPAYVAGRGPLTRALGLRSFLQSPDIEMLDRCWTPIENFCVLFEFPRVHLPLEHSKALSAVSVNFV
jgi:hypothetical protein